MMTPNEPFQIQGWRDGTMVTCVGDVAASEYDETIRRINSALNSLKERGPFDDIRIAVRDAMFMVDAEETEK